jgi:hypothetical protein
MRIDVYQMHGRDHDRRDPARPDSCGCLGEPGTTVTVDVPALPPVGSGIWIQGSTKVWKEVTVERYTFRDPKNVDRILCWASYNREE